MMESSSFQQQGRVSVEERVTSCPVDAHLNLQPWEDLAYSQQICTDKYTIGLRWSEESIRMVILDNRWFKKSELWKMQKKMTIDTKAVEEGVMLVLLFGFVIIFSKLDK